MHSSRWRLPPAQRRDPLTLASPWRLHHWCWSAMRASSSLVSAYCSGRNCGVSAGRGPLRPHHVTLLLPRRGRQSPPRGLRIGADSRARLNTDRPHRIPRAPPPHHERRPPRPLPLTLLREAPVTPLSSARGSVVTQMMKRQLALLAAPPCQVRRLAARSGRSPKRAKGAPKKPTVPGPAGPSLPPAPPQEAAAAGAPAPPPLVKVTSAAL